MKSLSEIYEQRRIYYEKVEIEKVGREYLFDTELLG